MPSRFIINFLFTYLSIFCLTTKLKSQPQNFRYFGSEQGLPNNYINAVTQDHDGYLWVSSSAGVFRFDGQIFTPFTKIENNKTEIPYTHFKVSKDYHIATTNVGDISVFKPGIKQAVKNFKPFNTPIHKVFLSLDSAYTYFISYGKGVARLQNKTLVLDLLNPALSELIITDLIAVDKTHLFLACSDGLFFYDVGTQKLKPLDDNIEALCLTWLPNKRLLYVGTKSFGLISYLIGVDYEVDVTANVYSNSENLDANVVTAIHKDKPEKGIYFTTSDGNFYYYNFSTHSQSSLLKRPLRVSITSIYIDKTNTIWLSSFGKGLFRSDQEPFDKFYKGRNITALATDEFANLYFAEENQIFQRHFKTEQLDSFGVQNGLPRDQITALHCDKKNTLWIGFLNNGLYYKPFGQKTFKSFEENEKFIDNPLNAITSSTYNELYVSTTLQGVLVVSNGSLISQYSTKNNLPHNNILFSYADSRNRIWFATHHSTLSYLEDGKIKDLSARYPNINFDINAITEDLNRNVWFMSRDNGLYLYNDSLRYVVNTENGLPSNFGTALVGDNSNLIWVAQTDLLTKFSLPDNILKTYRASTLLENMYFNKNAALKDKYGHLWFGTTEGLIKYNAAAHPLNLPEAKPELTAFKVFDEIRSLSQEQRLQYGAYNVSFRYSALCLTQSEMVLFRYMLDGYDKKWSEPTRRSKIDYEDLKDGIYTFKVMACNSEGLWNKVPLSYTFVIEKPFWKTVWFWTLILLLFILSISLFNYYRTRLLLSYNKELAKRVDEKTKQVEEEKQNIVEKNKEIENYVKEINASINYARHIQRSVLPSVEELNTSALSAFVINQPRDVVSGDFYKVYHQGYKTLILLADSTGHGVPGALLSMMGNSLLNTIIDAGAPFDPSAILHHLDKAIINTLQQKTEDYTSESMDAVVLVIDQQSNTLLYGGAKRPLYLVRNGQLNEYHGDKYPVGGLLTHVEKNFETHRISLQPGDNLYIFSDGFTDQFDERNAVKFSTKRLKESLTQLSKNNLQAQSFELSSIINTWKGTNEQTDDILLIGIKYKA